MPEDALVEAGVRIQASFAPKISLAFHQNAVPLMRELEIVNEGDKALTDIELTLSSEPSFLRAKTWRVDAVGANETYHLSDLDILLDGGLLSRLTEAEAAQATLVLTASGEEIARLSHPVELLPRNQWGGIGHLPEMLAAFVQPNDPAVDRILKKAAEVLRQNDRKPALNGYEDGPKRAWELASAIWAAVGSLGLDYTLPPASFEHAGQKVRGPSQICDGAIATCLDTALLFAACFEQCGLNPLVVMTRGHAFAGVWLKAEDFSSAVVDDVTALRKRAKLNELLVFETTFATQRPNPGFGRALERGAQQIAEAEEDKFELAIDIRRARMQRIRPLASAEATPAAPEPAAVVAVEPVFEAAPDLPDDEIVPEDVRPTTPQGRLERWQRKLLNLSLRNSLLNFKVSKRVIPFEAPDPGKLEDFLADGHRLKLLPRPDLMEGTDPRSAAIHEGRHHEDARRAHALDALMRDQVLVDLPQADLDARLVELYRAARSTLQEGGANTLFLALGFLSWTQGDKDDKRFRAPLILLPVTLERRSVRSGFSLLLHEDEPRFNPTLIEMLHQDFKLHIPVAEGELPKDDSGLDIAGIWRAVAHAVKDIKGWEVVEDVVLSTFSFAKYLMWKDLVDRTDQLKQNPVVRHLIDTPRDPYPSPQAFPNPRDLDRTHGPEQTFCPLAADSSQLSAVMAAARGKDFVLVGPPGTGKSQTIANLIAQCLAEQKTVLFVSEKIAALDVVYRRLREVGLGDFCLELHSNKARKLDVLEQLRLSWEAKGGVDAGEWRREAARLMGLRDHLNIFVEHLHRKRRNGLTAYGAIGRVVASKGLPELGLSWPSVDAHDIDALDRLREIAERLDVDAREVGAIAGNRLAPILNGEWSPTWQASLLAATRDLVPLCEQVETAAASFRQAMGLPQSALDRRSQDGLVHFARVVPQAAGRDWRFVLRPDVRSLADDLGRGLRLLKRHRDILAQLAMPWHGDLALSVKRGLDLIARHRETTRQLSVTYQAGLADLDVRQLKADWTEAENSWWPKSWFGKRAVTETLSAVAAGQQPDVVTDLDLLVVLRGLEDDIGALDHLHGNTGAPWRGLQTPTDDLTAALKFQPVLAAARANQDWNEEGLSAVADGRCGPDMAADLLRARDLRTLDADIAALDDIAGRTGGLWAGLKTRVEELEKALAFQEGLSAGIASLADTAEGLAQVKGPLERLLGDGNALLEPAGPVAGAGKAYGDALQRFRQAAEAFVGCAGLDDMTAATGDTPVGVAEACRGILAQEAKIHAWCAWRKARAEAVALGLAPLAAGIETGGVALGAVREAFEADYARWWLNATVDGDDVLRSFVSAEHEKRIADFKALDDRFTDLTRAYVRAGLCTGLPDQDDVGRNSEWGLLKREMQKQRRHLPLRELISRVPTALPKLTPCLLMSPLSIAQYLSAETTMFDLVVFDEASQIPVWDAIGAIARGRQVVMVGDPKQLPPTSFFERATEDADDDVEIDADSDLESILDECLGANLPTLDLTWHYRSRHESLIAFSNHRYYGGGLVTFPSPVTEDRAVNFQLVSDGSYEKGGARINKPEAKALVADLVGRLKDPAFIASKQTAGVVTFNSEQQRLIEDLLDEERRKDPSIEPHFAEDALEPVFVKNLESVQGDERDLMYFSITYGPDRTGAVSMNFGPMNRNGGERRLNVAITRARQELRVFSSLRPEQFDLSRTKAEGVKDLKHFLEFAERGPRALAEAVFGTIGDYDSPFEQAVAQALAARGWTVHPQVGVSSFRIDLGVVDAEAPGSYLAGIECDGATYHRSATARDRDKLREQVLRGLGWEILRIWSTDWWHDASGALDKVHDRLTALSEAARARRVEVDAKAAAKAAAKPRRAADDLFQATDFALSPTYAHNLAEDAAPFQAPTVFRLADPAAAVAVADPDAFYDPGYDDTLMAMIREVVAIEGPVRDDVLAKRIARAHGWVRTGSRIRDRVLSLSERAFTVTRDGAEFFVWPRGVDTAHWPTFRRPVGEETRPVDEIALPELAALAREAQAKGHDGEGALTAMARIAGLHKLRAASRERLEAAWRLATEEA